jgi:hypothetical protein
MTDKCKTVPVNPGMFSKTMSERGKPGEYNASMALLDHSALDFDKHGDISKDARLPDKR